MINFNYINFFNSLDYSNIIPWVLLLYIINFMRKEYTAGVKNLKDTKRNTVAGAYFQKLGMIGTVLGLLFLFYFNFNTADIGSILQGVALALLSTFFGMAFDISYTKKVQELTGDNGDSHISDLIREVKLGREENNNLLKSVISEFKNFADTMTKNNTESLIKAVEQVMKDFNTKINNNLGDTFTKLNSSVENLVRWQDQYKDHLEKLTNQINDAVFAVKESEKALTSISKNMETLPQFVDKLKDLITQVGFLSKEASNQVLDLDKRLSAFSEMKDKAVNAMPLIENNLNKLTEGLKENISSVVIGIEKSTNTVNESVKTQQADLTTMVSGVKQSVLEATSDIGTTMTQQLSKIESTIEKQQTHTDQMMEKIKSDMVTFLENYFSDIRGSIKEQQENLNTMAENVKNNITTSTEGMSDAVNTQIADLKRNSQALNTEINKLMVDAIELLNDKFEKFDGQMQTEMLRALTSLTEKVTGFQEKFIEVHGEMIDVIRSHPSEVIKEDRNRLNGQ